MKLEAGKFYRTRDGRKAYVAAVGCPLNAHKENLVLGWTEIDDDEAVPHSWSQDGRYYKESASRDDLIAPWIDPPWDYTPSPGEWVFTCDPVGHRCAVAFPMQEQIDDAREAGYRFAKMDQPPPPPGE